MNLVGKHQEIGCSPDILNFSHIDELLKIRIEFLLGQEILMIECQSC